MSNYTINAGDTLSKIAAANGTTIQKLVELNNIQNPNKIKAGAVLKLPEKTSVDVVNISNTTQDVNNTPSDATQTRNSNMRNLKTSYDAIMKNIDSMDLPEGVDREVFKEKFQCGYQAHIINNDFPNSLATPADFACDLISNAFNGCGVDFNMKDVVKYSAEQFPNDTIGGQKCSDLKDNAFSIIDNELILD